MAPQSDDRDKDSNSNSSSSSSSQSKPENPFIKFRQFADSHISSLLQGVLGLPSAFSKPSENPRWAIFDEDLRRRDELMARQQALKESEAQRWNGESVDEKVDIPVKTSPGWNNSRSTTDDQSTPYQPRGHGLRDIPLYSPVERSLFKPTDGAIDWPSVKPFPAHTVSHFLTLDQLSEDSMEMVRSMAFNNLNASMLMHSQSSLLPYLLFSPYSPIKLNIDSMKTSNLSHLSPIDYNAAFADLLATTFGKPGPSKFRLRYDNMKFAPPSVSRALGSMQWVDWYHANGLLQDPEIPDSPSDNMPQKDPQSEQDMYDTFLRLASLPTAATGTFESLFREVETAVEKGLSSKEAASFRAQREAFEKEHATGLRELEGLLKGLGNPFREEKNQEIAPGSRIREESTVIPPATGQDSDRVVSTRTVTQHSTDESGTVETSVTVVKCFADGRVTTTTTSHTETPDDEPSFERNGQDPSTLTEKSQQSSDEIKKNAKKGWFWN
jgi:hypothetical protein